MSRRSGSRSARRSSRCSCTRSSTAASWRTRSRGSCSAWPPAGSAGRRRRPRRPSVRAGAQPWHEGGARCPRGLGARGSAVRPRGDQPARAGLRPLALQAREHRGRGPAGAAGAGGGRGVRPRHPPRRRVHGRPALRRGGGLAARRAPAAAAGLGRRGARAGGRRDCSAHRPRCFSLACATRPLPGSSPTTRPIRPRSAASCCWSSTTHTDTTTGARASSASTRATAACRSGCSTARWPSSTSPTSRVRW